MIKNLINLVIVFVLAIVLFYGYNYLYNVELSYVTIDINPSVELAVDGDEVVEVIELNEDADIITNELDLIGLSLDEATTKIMESATETGYIDEFGEDNEVTITAYSEKEEARVDLQSKVLKRVTDHMKERKINITSKLAGVTETIKTEAEANNISNGKMLLVERAMNLDPTLDKATLITSSIKSIQESIKTNVKARREEISKNKEELKQIFEEKKQERIEKAKEKIEALKTKLIEENKAKVNSTNAAEREKVIKELLDEKKEAIKEQIKNRTGNTQR